MAQKPVKEAPLGGYGRHPASDRLLRGLCGVVLAVFACACTHSGLEGSPSQLLAAKERSFCASALAVGADFLDVRLGRLAQTNLGSIQADVVALRSSFTALGDQSLESQRALLASANQALSDLQAASEWVPRDKLYAGAEIEFAEFAETVRAKQGVCGTAAA